MSTRLTDDMLSSKLPIPVMLPVSPQSPRVARTLLKSVLAESLHPDVLADVELIATELVTNAVMNAGTLCTLTVSVPHPEVVRIAVADFTTQMPEVVDANRDAVHGRGLMIVQQLALRWGIEPATPLGKNVWFEMPLSA